MSITSSVSIVPNAARTVTALRKIGYDRKIAIGDLVDNSAESGAKTIEVFTDKKSMRIVIVDDGAGIAPEIRGEVLKLGSKTNDRYRRKSWSKFGVGMKTAAWSMGKRMVIVTKSQGETTATSMIVDIDEIEKCDDWISEVRRATSAEQEFLGSRTSGTAVIVEKLDQLESGDLSRLGTQLPQHFGLTYGKVLAQGEMTIKVNGNRVEAIDPLHRADTKPPDPVTILLNKEPVVLKTDDGRSVNVVISATHLPHPELLKVSDPERYKKYRYKMANQGIYAYREGRLIAQGETFEMWSKDFHLNGFRAEIDFGEEADEFLSLDVTKSYIGFTQACEDKIWEILKPAQNQSNNLWRTARPDVGEDEEKMHEIAEELIEAKERLFPVLRKGPAVEADRKRTEQRKSHTGNEIPVVRGVNQNEGKEEKDESPTIEFVRDLPSNVLWEPFINSGKVGVRINNSHPYARELFPILRDLHSSGNPTILRLIDGLFYSLGRAELHVATEDTVEEFQNFRHSASIHLSTLVR